jgi:hypothetical protein
LGSGFQLSTAKWVRLLRPKWHPSDDAYQAVIHQEREMDACLFILGRTLLPGDGAVKRWEHHVPFSGFHPINRAFLNNVRSHSQVDETWHKLHPNQDATEFSLYILTSNSVRYLHFSSSTLGKQPHPPPPAVPTGFPLAQVFSLLRMTSNLPRKLLNHV